MPQHEGWFPRWWRALAAELAGTALLVALGCMSLAPRLAAPGQHPPLTHPALAFGGAVTMLVAGCGAASGAHLNPAVSLGALIAGRARWAPMCGYLVAQLAGAALGYGLLLAVVPASAAWGGACTAPADGVAPAAAAAVEALLTGALVLLCCALWAAHDDRSPDHAAPLKLGLVVAGLVYSGGWLTGASLNPARSLAPALFHGCWQHQWVYWVGPLGGAALAALLHSHVLLPRAPPAAAAAAAAAAPASPAGLGEELPLQDKLEQC